MGLTAFDQPYAGRPRNDGLVLKVVPDDTMRGLELRNMDTGESLSTVRDRIQSASASFPSTARSATVKPVASARPR